MSFFMTSLSSPDATRSSWAVEKIMSFLPGHWVERLQGEKTFVTAMCLVLVLFIGAKNLLTGFTVSRTTVFSEKLSLFTSHETYRRYFNMSYFWHISPESADVLMRLNCRASLSSMASAVMMFFSYTVCSMLMFGMLFYYEPVVAIVLFAIFTAVSVSTYAGMRKKVDMAGQRLQEITGKELWSTNMAVRGIREIIIYRKGVRWGFCDADGDKRLMRSVPCFRFRQGGACFRPGVIWLSYKPSSAPPLSRRRIRFRERDHPQAGPLSPILPSV